MATRSTSLGQDREKLCRLIAQLPPNATYEAVRERLDPFLMACRPPTEQNESVHTPTLSDCTITPWIMACDKAQVACLQYLQQKQLQEPWLTDLLGDPTMAIADTGNAAVHHAAAANCFAALQILLVGNSSLQLKSILAQGNDHGDTPLMMAAAAGHLEFLTQAWEAAEHGGKCDDNKTIWTATNNDNDSCLTLAARDGNTEVVTFLLQRVQVLVTNNDWTLLRQTMDKAHQICQLHENKKNTKLQQQIKAMEECMELVQKALEVQSHAAAMELLKQEEMNYNSTANTKKSKNDSKKASRKKRPEDMKTCRNTPRQHTSPVSLPNNEAVSDSSAVNVTTLADGRRAVRVQGPDAVDIEKENPISIIASQPFPSPTVQDMFRQRFQEGGITISSESSVDAVMQALCLDPSMLLYTPHGMALHLSPSQLDAVEGILQHQLEAVHRARQLQAQRAQQHPNVSAAESLASAISKKSST